MKFGNKIRNLKSEVVNNSERVENKLKKTENITNLSIEI